MFNRNLAITNCFRKNEEAGPNQKQCSVVDVSGGEMAAHSSTLAWKIPCTEEPGGLQSMVFLKKVLRKNVKATHKAHSLTA